MTNEESKTLIAKLAALPTQIEALVTHLSADQLTQRPLANEWSVAQNVHHLVDSHMNSYIRCKLIATEQNPLLKPYDQDAWAMFEDASTADVSVSLSLLKGLHHRWAQFFSTQSDADWDRTGVHMASGVVTLGGLLKSYVQHGEDHIDQIKRTIAAVRS
jgi:hypothetical protein